MSTTFKELNISNPGTSTKYGGNDTDLINKLFNGVVAGIPQVIVKSQNRFGFGDGIAWIYNQAANKKTTLRGQSNTPATDVDLALPPITGNDVLAALNLTQSWLQKQQFNAGIVHLEMDEPAAQSITKHILYIDSASKHLMRKDSAGVIKDYDTGAGGDSLDLTASSINARTLTAGNQGIEFGPNTAGGGVSFIDWHISNADGDYATRFIRNTGLKGRFDFSQSTNAGFRFNRVASVSTVGGGIDPLFALSETIQTTDDVGSQPYVGFLQTLDYRANDIVTSPTSPGATAVTIDCKYGVSAADRATGDMAGRAIQMNVKGAGNVLSEIVADVGYISMNLGESIRAWYTDWNVMGSVGVQPGKLQGIGMTINNFYNGSPLISKSCGLAVVTGPTMGIMDAEHAAATVYKLDYGIAIQGFGGTTGAQTRGIEIGLQIGSNSTIYMSTTYASKIGTGIRLTDIESTGIDLNDPATSASSPAGIKVSTTTRTWETFIDLSGGLAPNTCAIKLANRDIRGTTIQQFEAAANIWDFRALSSTLCAIRLMPNIATVSTNAQRAVIQFLNVNTGTELLTIRAAGIDGYNIIADYNGGGSARPMNFYMGTDLMLKMKTDLTWDFNNRTVINPVIMYPDVSKTNTDSPYSITTTNRTVRLNATSGAITAVLPTAVGVTGKKYTIRRTDILASTNMITISTTSSQTIATAPNWFLAPGEFLEVISDGANWEVIHCSSPSAFNYHITKGTADGRYFYAGESTNVATLTSTTSPAANTLWALPFFVPKVMKMDQMQFDVTTGAAANARVGIYRDNGNCYPGALIFDSGDIDTTVAAVKSSTITSTVQVFPPGLYWIVWQVSAATIQMRILGATGLYGLVGHSGTFSLNPPSYGWTISNTGALPATYTAGGTALFAAPAPSNPIPAIALRVL